eukprot:scaffold279188_cov41-Prasinocladus_malaysianus.AAC.1
MDDRAPGRDPAGFVLCLPSCAIHHDVVDQGPQLEHRAAVELLGLRGSECRPGRLGGPHLNQLHCSGLPQWHNKARTRQKNIGLIIFLYTHRIRKFILSVVGCNREKLLFPFGGPGDDIICVSFALGISPSAPLSLMLKHTHTVNSDAAACRDPGRWRDANNPKLGQWVATSLENLASKNTSLPGAAALEVARVNFVAKRRGRVFPSKRSEYGNNPDSVGRAKHQLDA